MKHLILIMLFIAIAVFVIYKYLLFGFSKENFENPQGWVLQDSEHHYQDAHGSAPPGVGASPGDVQYEQNSASPPVNPVNKNGNPQNVMAQFKKQPLLI